MRLSGGYKTCSFQPGCGSQRERGQSGGAGSAGLAALGSLAWSAPACGGQSSDLGYAQGAAIISYTLQNCVGIFFLPLSCIIANI